MDLPPLPKQNKDEEARFGIQLRKWLKTHPQYSCTLELKQTETDNLPFSALEPEQIAWGLAIDSSKGALIRVQGLRGEPDYVWCRNMPSYVAIRYPGAFCLIALKAFLAERDASRRKSLTSKRAFAIASQVIHRRG